jgi:presenilin-like A22 family membrane protease
MNQGERKVPLDMACIMTGFALIFDLFGIFLEFWSFGIGGVAMDVWSTIVFTIWFHHYEISVWGNKNVGWSLAAVFLDALPFTDLTLPWTFRVATLAFSERHALQKPDIQVPNKVEPMPNHLRF